MKTKKSVLKDLNKYVYEILKGDKDIILSNVKTDISYKEVQLVDISFGWILARDEKTKYDQVIFSFVVHGEKIKVDYLTIMDENNEGVEYYDEVDYLLPHNLYTMRKYADEAGDPDLHYNEDGRFKNRHALVQILEFINFKEIINFISDDIEQLKDLFFEEKGKQFYEENKHYLKSFYKFDSISCETRDGKFRIVQDSGVSFYVDKEEIVTGIQKESTKEEINNYLKKIMNHNNSQIKSANGDAGGVHAFTKNGETVYDFFMDEKKEKEVEPVEYYGKEELQLFISNFFKEFNKEK
ncbi:hypothetical protein U8V72_22315 [Priestia filamentosa]|uniref:hypothetical protein n=1 Tax=Priestia filamentosa TaxID=1402861 RepID=UPI00397CF611